MSDDPTLDLDDEGQGDGSIEPGFSDSESFDSLLDGTEPVVEAGTETDTEVPVEDPAAILAAIVQERDDYLDGMRRLQAEFENYRKAVAKREVEARERANETLVAELLPILDACDGAVDNEIEGVAPIRAALTEALTKQGLDRIDPVDAPFDPEQHEAVMHQPGEGDGGPVVSAVLRVGYSWKGRTLRAAMVQVSG